MKKDKTPMTVIDDDYFDQKFFTQKEWAEKYGVSEQTVQRLRERGLLHYHQEGKVILISQKQTNDFLKHTLKNSLLDYALTDYDNDFLRLAERFGLTED